MNQKVFLIHGWSVTETSTYQALHLKLAENGFDLKNIFLGRYVSLEDKVEIEDIAKAMHNALKKEMKGNWNQPFHFITHSTGALIAKQWIVQYYKNEFAKNKPLKNVVFLAGPQFGSRLAHHGRSMIAQLKYLGDTGAKVLTALELGSEFSWEIHDKFLNFENWKAKGVRPYCIVGDRVKKDFFASKIFPGAFEEGSDMVVRVAAGNLNFKRFELRARGNKIKSVGKIEGVPFAALSDFTHSGPEFGIMNSIKKSTDPKKHLSLKLIIECLKVTNNQMYAKVRNDFIKITKLTRRKRKAFAQLDFRFRDEEGNPIDDYLFRFGEIVNGREVPSKTVEHTHKNKISPSHFTVFINVKELKPNRTFYFDFNSDSGTSLFHYLPDPLRVKATSKNIKHFICDDQTTQFDVILSKEPGINLFVFQRGDDENLHVKWDRDGEIIENNISVK